MTRVPPLLSGGIMLPGIAQRFPSRQMVGSRLILESNFVHRPQRLGYFSDRPKRMRLRLHFGESIVPDSQYNSLIARLEALKNEIPEVSVVTVHGFRFMPMMGCI